MINIQQLIDLENEELLSLNSGKKFDIVLMNPPYAGSLHLKFLERAIEVADNVVSIQPIRWLEEVVRRDKKTSLYNKYEESISKHIKDLEIITSEEAKKLFNILLPANVGIYVCDENGGFDYSGLSKDSIMDKVVDYLDENKCDLEHNKKDGYRIRIPVVFGGKAQGSGDRPPNLTNLPIKDIVFNNGKHNGKWWYEYYVKNQYSKTTEEITDSIKFNSETEAHNFVHSILHTYFCRYVEDKLIVDVNINNSKILWMGNAKHPRTGKIGYKTEWTDEDFYKFFNITNEERNKIEEYIDNADKRLEEWKQTHRKK